MKRTTYNRQKNKRPATKAGLFYRSSNSITSSVELVVEAAQVASSCLADQEIGS
ncbi:hypothetical protein JCM19239_6121 [Vibrio variabilis]|uniref:Uncharacterized protein n=1 Tax=Vibrio variabilis TaxID=990271 RepID=A0ABQ0JJV0_9VIBR|nr:hypothetical protein JCM19239_6121 [Vibrio variabilis]